MGNGNDTQGNTGQGKRGGLIHKRQLVFIVFVFDMGGRESLRRSFHPGTGTFQLDLEVSTSPVLVAGRGIVSQKVVVAVLLDDTTQPILELAWIQ
jgi:hypothetical protein